MQIGWGISPAPLSGAHLLRGGSLSPTGEGGRKAEVLFGHLRITCDNTASPANPNTGDFFQVCGDLESVWGDDGNLYILLYVCIKTVAPE